MTDRSTSYDRVRYPSVVFQQTRPERLAVLARLAGLDPVPPAGARLLEIGGGDCLNSIAFAAAHPAAKVCGFDLSQAAIKDGLAIVAGAGLQNVELVVEDILRAAQRYPARSFDYVIAHGVYAWVPEAVREATMALVGHVLAERGVGFISYNVSAGGHVRQYLREMLLEVLRGIEDPDDKLARAREFLIDFTVEGASDTQLTKAIREQAGRLLERQAAVLFHDELGDFYNPQSLRQFCEAAERHGLRHLTDAGRNRCFDGFLSEDEEPVGNGDEQVLRAGQLDDFETMRFFRQTLVVRAEQPIDRRIDPGRIADLFVSSRMQFDAQNELHYADGRISLQDDELAGRIDALGKAFPRRTALSEVAIGAPQRQALVQLYADWFVNLHLGPLPFPTEVGERPIASPLVCYQIRQGEENLATLDHGLLRIAQPEVRALLLAADGTRTLAELAAMDHGIPGDEVNAALNAAARLGLMLG